MLELLNNHSLILSVVAIASMFSPIVVAILNNRHHIKVLEIELSQRREEEFLNHFKSTYEAYFKAVGKLVSNPSNETLAEYGNCFPVALALFPPKSHDRLKTINALIRAEKWEEANDQLEEFSIWISGLLKRMHTGYTA